MIQIILKAVFVGFADRFRGNGGIFTIDGVTYNTARIITLLLMGWSLSIIFGHYIDRDALNISLLVGLGLSVGWGMPLGSILMGITQRENLLRNPKYTYEWWQFGVLKQNAYAALAFRGVLVGVPLAFYAPLYGGIVMLSYTISFPLAVKMVLMLKLKDGWGGQEIIRSILSGVIAGSIVGLIS